MAKITPSRQQQQQSMIYLSWALHCPVSYKALGTQLPRQAIKRSTSTADK